MKLSFTILFILLSYQFVSAQTNNANQGNTYLEAVKLYREDPYLYTGTIYAIYQVPIGTYRNKVQDRGWGVGVENRIGFLKWKSAFKPIYSVNTTINRWTQQESLATDIILSGQVGLNYLFPIMSEIIKPYVQALLGASAAGSYLVRDKGYIGNINHQGFGPTGSIGTGIYVNRIHVGLACNFLKVTLKNETEVNQNMSSLHLRVGARL